MRYDIPSKNVHIEAEDLRLGSNIQFGSNISIKVRDTLSIGDNSYIGDRFSANAENITIGQYFYYKPTDGNGVTIGGGSSDLPFSNLTIGNRCVCHTGHINLARPVIIGSDVGLSHDISILTHGFWASSIEGYPTAFESVHIGNNVILGWKTTILPGVKIVPNVVVGANSLITKSINASGIYGGNPAKFIKDIVEPDEPTKVEMLNSIVNEFKELLSYYKYSEFTITNSYPIVYINKLKLNVKDLTWSGEHDYITDAFRDFLRRKGIRIFAPQGFQWKLLRK